MDKKIINKKSEDFLVNDDFECIYMVDVDENVYVGDIFWQIENMIGSENFEILVEFFFLDVYGKYNQFVSIVIGFDFKF